ncbi:hypothetical protein BGZ63DRAFT_77990 [Mariannaea sp. PMI_226]|nr:hypothetical protein BGZ63DRAFT_77990 [Mariannaea sp. PMI_226]
MAPDSSRRAAINCGATVAWLEGRAWAEFGGDSVPNDTLPVIDSRVRILEDRYKIATPPPSVEATWESLAWRISRVHQSQPMMMGPGKAVVAKIFMDLLPDDLEISIETLKTICLELGRSRPIGFTQSPWPKCTDDEEMLSVIRQRLCYVAGRERINYKGGIPVKKREIYAELVSLSLRLSPSNQTSRGWPVPTGGPPVILNPHQKKICCGCCSCNCHDADNDDDDDDDSAYESESRWRKIFGFGWLRKLACWRSKNDDDAMSTSTRSDSVSRSSTIKD